MHVKYYLTGLTNENDDVTFTTTIGENNKCNSKRKSLGSIVRRKVITQMNVTRMRKPSRCQTKGSHFLLLNEENQDSSSEEDQ
jgi:hypothetical protein